MHQNSSFKFSVINEQSLWNKQSIRSPFRFNKEKAAAEERRKEKEKQQLAEQAARAEIDAANRR